MSAFDSEMSDMLSDVMATFGQTITIERRTRGAFNATTGQRASTTTTMTVTAHRLPVERAAESGRSVPTDTRRFSFQAAGLAFTPTEGDVVVDADGARRVVVGKMTQCNGLEIVVDTRIVAES